MAKSKAGSDKKTTANKESQTAIFRCVGQGVRDVSFECPVAAYEAGDMSQEMDLNIAVSVNPKEKIKDIWDVTLAMRAQMKGGEEKASHTLFLAELAYSGAFMVKNIEDSQRAGLLHVEGAAMLYPFARQILMQLISEGGYRPPLLDPINFLVLYQQGAQKSKSE